jgi:hypothetical protein
MSLSATQRRSAPTGAAYQPVSLRILFEPRGDGALLRWEAEVLGARTSRLAAPLPAEDLPLVLRALDVLQDPAYPHAVNGEQDRHFSFGAADRARLAALGLWAEQRVRPDAPRRLGRRLFNALTMDPAAQQALGTVRDHAAALGRPLALELCFPPGAIALAALPWELLWDDGPAPLLLARGAVGGLSRRLDLPQPLPPPREATGPLRILAISPKAGIAPELRQVERAARLAAWQPLVSAGQAEIREVEPADRAAVLRAVTEGAPPDIVHYYGHGRMRGAEGELQLDGGAAGWTPASALAATFGGASLVVLHACQGATLPGAPGEGEPLVGGVAQALCAAGVPAVIGMQLTVRVSAATRAAAAIYAALAAGRSLQEAVAAARQALFVEERDGASWFVPALYLRDRASGLFFLREAASAPARAQPDTLADLDEPLEPLGQTVIARGGGTIRALRIQSQGAGAQTVVADSGGQISDVSIVSVGTPGGSPPRATWAAGLLKRLGGL